MGARVDKWLEDRFVLKIDGEDFSQHLKSYKIEMSVFRQPGAFCARIGYAGALTDLEERYTLMKSFELRVQREVPDSSGDLELDLPMMVGVLDSSDPKDDGTSEIEFIGRDAMAPLFGSSVLSGLAFSEASYFDITAKCMRLCGQDPDALLLTGETARKKAVVGAKAMPVMVESVDATTKLVELVDSGKTKLVYATIKADVGNNLYSWLCENYKRAGLFLWALPNGQLALSVPNVTTEPMFEIRRTEYSTRADCQLERIARKYNSAELHSKIHVFGRTGVGKSGRGKVHAIAENIDVINRGIQREASFSEDVSTQKEADFLAQRYLSDERRKAFQLHVVVSGHTSPNLGKPGTCVPWQLNQLVRIDDYKTGIKGVFYIGDVTFDRGEHGTSTALKLYRTKDLSFAEKMS